MHLAAAPMHLAAASRLSNLSPLLIPRIQGTARISCHAADQPYAKTGTQPPTREGNQLLTPCAPATGAFSYQKGSFYYLYIQTTG